MPGPRTLPHRPTRRRTGGRLAPRLLAALALAGLAGACTFAPPPAESFSEALYLYREADPKKAIALAAVAREGRGRSAWGVATGSLTQGHANEKALETCTRNAGRAGLDARCQLFAVGDAPAPDTVEACRAGQLPAYRCELQERYRDRLPEG